MVDYWQQGGMSGNAAVASKHETPAVLGGEDYHDQSGEVFDSGDRNDVSGRDVAVSVPHGPDAYELDYGAPDGIDPYVDQQFRNFAHENGISGELAQKLVDFNNQLEAANMAENDIKIDAWEKQTRALPGWQGKNYRENMGVANKALQTFASPELAELISSSGLSCHPEVVKTFYNIGMRLAEDSYVDGRKNARHEKTIGEILYPNQPV